MPPRIPISLPTPLLRQIARTRSISTSVQKYQAKRSLPLKHLPSSIPPSPTLAALSSRLSLTPSPHLHPSLLACLTHPSYARSEGKGDTETNELLSSLGNSLLGLFASEHLAQQYPYLPTEALKSGVTAFVGPSACFSVARELGVGVVGEPKVKEPVEGQRRKGDGHGGRPKSEGVGVRWVREIAYEKVPVARRFRGRMEREQGAEQVMQRREGWEGVVAGVVRAFVGLIYQEKGMAAARKFTHAHFLSRYLDMTSLFNFQNPKHVLSRVVAKHLSDTGVEPGEGQGKIQSRLLASTGTNSQSPLFNIGLFLPSGLKLSEGYGSSLKMAEHRAAVNALHALFLVRAPESGSGSSVGNLGSSLGIRENSMGAGAGDGEVVRTTLPTEAHDVWAIEGGKVSRGLEYTAATGWAGSEVIIESARR